MKFKASDNIRTTGSPDTCLGGSVGCALVILSAGLKDWTEEGWADTGMKCKLHRHESIGDGTFLRGRFYQHELTGAPVWGPLPSAVLKWGKIVSEPGLRNTDEVRAAAYGMAMGISPSATNIPIVGTFRDALFRNSDHSAEVKKWQWRITADPSPVSRAEALAFMIRRYDICAEEIREVEAAFRRVSRLPVFIGHRVFERLAVVDYA